jgi:hypothetical protein
MSDPDYGQSPWGGYQGDEHFPDMEYGGGLYRPRRRMPRGSVVAGAAAVVVVVLGGLGIWWLGGGPGTSSVTGSPTSAAMSRTSAAPTTGTSPRSTSPTSEPATQLTTPTSPAAYDVGSCFDETTGTAPGRVELNPVACGSDQSVFVINKIVTKAADCDVGTDYHEHGYEVPDVTANVAYCAALVVPASMCFVLGGGQPVARAACGSGPYVVEVLAVESASDVRHACADKTNPDVWYFQSATSGQYACVSRPAANPSGSTTPTG